MLCTLVCKDFSHGQPDVLHLSCMVEKLFTLGGKEEGGKGMREEKGRKGKRQEDVWRVLSTRTYTDLKQSCAIIGMNLSLAVSTCRD